MSTSPLPDPTPPTPPTEVTGGGAAARPRRWVPIRTLHAGHRDKVRAHLLALSDEAKAFAAWVHGAGATMDTLIYY